MKKVLIPLIRFTLRIRFPVRVLQEREEIKEFGMLAILSEISSSAWWLVDWLFQFFGLYEVWILCTTVPGRWSDETDLYWLAIDWNMLVWCEFAMVWYNPWIDVNEKLFSKTYLAHRSERFLDSEWNASNLQY